MAKMPRYDASFLPPKAPQVNLGDWTNTYDVMIKAGQQQQAYWGEEAVAAAMSKAAHEGSKAPIMRDANGRPKLANDVMDANGGFFRDSKAQQAYKAALASNFQTVQEAENATWLKQTANSVWHDENYSWVGSDEQESKLEAFDELVKSYEESMLENTPESLRNTIMADWHPKMMEQRLGLINQQMADATAREQDTLTMALAQKEHDILQMVRVPGHDPNLLQVDLDKFATESLAMAQRWPQQYNAEEIKNNILNLNTKVQNIYYGTHAVHLASGLTQNFDMSLTHSSESAIRDVPTRHERTIAFNEWEKSLVAEGVPNETISGLRTVFQDSLNREAVILEGHDIKNSMESLSRARVEQGRLKEEVIKMRMEQISQEDILSGRVNEFERELLAAELEAAQMVKRMSGLETGNELRVAWETLGNKISAIRSDFRTLLQDNFQDLDKLAQEQRKLSNSIVLKLSPHIGAMVDAGLNPEGLYTLAERIQAGYDKYYADLHGGKRVGDMIFFGRPLNPGGRPTYGEGFEAFYEATFGQETDSLEMFSKEFVPLWNRLSNRGTSDFLVPGNTLVPTYSEGLESKEKALIDFKKYCNILNICGTVIRDEHLEGFAKAAGVTVDQLDNKVIDLMTYQTDNLSSLIKTMDWEAHQFGLLGTDAWEKMYSLLDSNSFNEVKLGLQMFTKLERAEEDGNIGLTNVLNNYLSAHSHKAEEIMQLLEGKGSEGVRAAFKRISKILPPNHGPEVQIDASGTAEEHIQANILSRQTLHANEWRDWKQDPIEADLVYTAMGPDEQGRFVLEHEAGHMSSALPYLASMTNKNEAGQDLDDLDRFGKAALAASGTLRQHIMGSPSALAKLFGTAGYTNILAKDKKYFDLWGLKIPRPLRGLMQQVRWDNTTQTFYSDVTIPQTILRGIGYTLNPLYWADFDNLIHEHVAGAQVKQPALADNIVGTYDEYMEDQRLIAGREGKHFDYEKTAANFWKKHGHNLHPTILGNYKSDRFGRRQLTVDYNPPELAMAELVTQGLFDPNGKWSNEAETMSFVIDTRQEQLLTLGWGAQTLDGLQSIGRIAERLKSSGGMVSGSAMDAILDGNAVFEYDQVATSKDPTNTPMYTVKVKVNGVSGEGEHWIEIGESVPIFVPKGYNIVEQAQAMDAAIDILMELEANGEWELPEALRDGSSVTRGMATASIEAARLLPKHLQAQAVFSGLNKAFAYEWYAQNTSLGKKGWRRDRHDGPGLIEEMRGTTGGLSVEAIAQQQTQNRQTMEHASEWTSETYEKFIHLLRTGEVASEEELFIE